VRIPSSAMAWPNSEPRLPCEKAERNAIPNTRRFHRRCRCGSVSRPALALWDSRRPTFRMTPLRIDAKLMLVEVRRRARSEGMT
jgi:hypothetical protein